MPVPGAVPKDVILQDAMVRIGDRGVPAYVAEPALPARSAIVVLHEAMGLNAHIRDVARRFAHVGYLAVAPDLYHRVGAPPEDDLDALLAAMFALPDHDVVADVASTAAWVRARLGDDARVGLVGFCAGGRWSLLTACTTSSVDAVVDCWGGFLQRATFDEETTPARPQRVIDEVANLSAPLLAVFGEEDTNPSPEDAQVLRQRLSPLPQETQVRVFDDAGHAFFADYRPSYRPEAAHALWDEMSAFFERHLGNEPITPSW